jgi:hypothetical protein
MVKTTMNKSMTALLLIAVLSLPLCSCGSKPPSIAPQAPTTTSETQTSTSLSTPTTSEQGRTVTITSTADNGPGTLRQAMAAPQEGDTIIFDTVIFPPDSPTLINLTSELPHIHQNNVTIDASNAGVILDGSQISDWASGLEIHASGCSVQGLQIMHFSPGAGIVLAGGGQYNTVGGDRSQGIGPLGQGNLVVHNDIGIGIWDEGTSHNTVMGNVIGTDLNGMENWGNDGAGIWIDGGAHHNTVGPENLIMHNEHGIAIRGAGSFSNVITRNSIDQNRQKGILLEEDANGMTATPIIFDFDLADGTLAGSSCASCGIEVFSDAAEQGTIYEGSTTADSTGTFTFEKGSQFAGPHLTATATDAEGNTSTFSKPTSGEQQRLILQMGNENPRTLLQTKRSEELLDNRIGSVWNGWREGEMEPIIDDILLLGLKRVRLAINGISWDTINWDKPELKVYPGDEQIFTRLADNDITITYTLTFWDKASWPKGDDANCPRFKTEEEIQHYLEFVQFIVHHFKDRVQYYEIWNEPNMGWDQENMQTCIQAIDVDDYISLVRQAVPVIRQEYPEAKIVVGSIMPQIEMGARQYLLGILQSDIMPLVDVIAWHPGGPSPEYEIWRENYNLYPSLVQEIKDIATAHGFKGEYTADEMVWWTQEDFPSYEPWTYSDTVAAKYYARFILLHLGMDVTVQPGGVSSARSTSFHMIQNLCALMAGAQPINLPIEIQNEGANIMHYAFSLPNGEKLLGIWTHGAAKEEDHGIEAILTIPAFSAQKAVGVDVLNGYEQQLMIENKDGNVVIQNFYLRDYPIVLRFSDNTQ